jgi:hypothetical protein
MEFYTKRNDESVSILTFLWFQHAVSIALAVV